MKHSVIESALSIFKLFRFVFWYGIAVAGVLYVLPMAASYLQDQYEALSSVARLLALVGFFVVIGIWQLLEIRSRMLVRNDSGSAKHLAN